MFKCIISICRVGFYFNLNVVSQSGGSSAQQKRRKCQSATVYSSIGIDSARKSPEKKTHIVAEMKFFGIRHGHTRAPPLRRTCVLTNVILGLLLNEAHTYLGALLFILIIVGAFSATNYPAAAAVWESACVFFVSIEAGNFFVHFGCAIFILIELYSL